jgi:hypothetical protein
MLNVINIIKKSIVMYILDLLWSILKNDFKILN